MRPEGRLDALLPVLNEWLGEVAAKKSGMPPELLRLSLCRWPGIDFKAVAGLLSGTPSLQSLDLIECDLQDDALREHIGPAVGKMTIPFDLYLDGNPITDDGLMQALGEGWLALDRLSLATCEKLTTGLHARLREVRRNLLPNLRHISLYMTALTPEDARAYLMQRIAVFAPQLGQQWVPAPLVAAIVQVPGFTFQTVEDFGRMLCARLYPWD